MTTSSKDADCITRRDLPAGRSEALAKELQQAGLRPVVQNQTIAPKETNYISEVKFAICHG